MDYYICDYQTQKVLYGPLASNQVVEFINASETPKKYCNMSRYMLAKNGIYPSNAIGNEELRADLRKSPLKSICQHSKVNVYSRKIASATRYEPEEYEDRIECRQCGESLDEVPDGAAVTSLPWDALECDDQDDL